jgi:hypothetical protein
MSALAVPKVETDLFNLLVVSSDVGRVMATRHAACGWPFEVNIEWVGTWHEAVRRARELPARLVVVDCDVGLAEGTALVRHLTRHVIRHQPGVDVLAFAELEARCTHAKTTVWPWSVLALVLDDCILQQLNLNAACTPPGA